MDWIIRAAFGLAFIAGGSALIYTHAVKGNLTTGGKIAFGIFGAMMIIIGTAPFF